MFKCAMRRTLLTAIAGSALVLAACGGTATDDEEAASTPDATVEETSEPETAEPEPEPEPEFTTTAKDWAVNLVVTQKQCFGSAGCNVTVEPEFEYLAATPLPDSGTVTIRVSISGDESGEIIESYEASMSTGQVSYQETSMSTANGDIVPEAEVTSAKYQAS